MLDQLDLRDAVGRLDDRDRELIALRFGADLSARQIAEVLELKTNAVEVALHRALARSASRARDRRGAGRRARSEAEAVAVNGTLAVPVARTSHAAAVLSELIFVVGVFAVTVGLAAANGGYFPTSWGWSALALFFAAAAALLLRTTVRLGRFELVFLGLVTALVGWTWLSSLWSIDLSSSILEGQRGLVLIGAVGAVLMLAPARPVKPLLGAVCAATTAISAYALATRLFPGRVGSYDPLAVYRLNTPIGYWNGLGVFAVLGAVLALGFAARGTRAGHARRAAAASLLMLVPTLYFTFSRGAWLAALAGLAVLFALDPRRLQLAAAALCVLPWPALAVALASRSDALTRQSSILPQRCARRAPPRARTRLARGCRRRDCDRAAADRAARDGSALGTARVRGRADRRAPRRGRRRDRPLRESADDRAQGVRLVHCAGEEHDRSQRATLQPLEQRTNRPLACRLEGGQGASDRRWRSWELRALLRRTPEHDAASPGRAQPLSRDACRARAARPRVVARRACAPARCGGPYAAPPARPCGSRGVFGLPRARAGRLGLGARRRDACGAVLRTCVHSRRPRGAAAAGALEPRRGSALVSRPRRSAPFRCSD